MVSDREGEVEKFTPREYWSVTARLVTSDASAFDARLTHADGRKLPPMGISNGGEAAALAERISNVASWRVAAAARKPGKRQPAPPFTTSSMQQEAARRLGWGASKTMSVAQALYEGKDAGGVMWLICVMFVHSV